MTYKITIPISKRKGELWQRMYPLSWNVYERMHWRVRHKVNNLWYKYVKTLARNQKISLLDHPTIQLRIYFPTEQDRDWGNFTFKPIYDSLIIARIIKDDSDREVDIQKPEMFYDKENPRTEIILIVKGEANGG